MAWGGSNGSTNIMSLIKVPNSNERFNLDENDVKYGDLVLVENSSEIYQIVDVENLDNENGFRSYEATILYPIEWYDIKNRPDKFIPKEHEHDTDDIEGIDDYVKKSEVEEGFEDKVDKEEGKGLSSNDFSSAYKIKLQNIQKNATAYTFDEDYNSLKNTPEKLSEFKNDLGFITGIDEEMILEHVESLTISEEQIKDLDKYTQDEIDYLISEIEKGVESNQHDIVIITSEIEELGESIENLESEVSENQEEISELKKDGETRDSKIKETTNKVDKNSDVLDDISVNVNVNSNDIDTIEDSLMNVDETTSENKKDISSNYDILTSLKKDINDLNEEIDENKNKIDNNVSKISKIKEDIEFNKNGVENNGINIEELFDSVNTLRNFSLGVFDNLKNVKEDTEDNSGKISELDSLTETHNGKISKLESNVIKNRNDTKSNENDIKVLKDEVSNNLNNINGNKKDISSNREKSEDNSKNIQMLEKVSNDNKESVDGINEDIEKLDNVLENVLNDTEDNKSNLEDHQEKLEKHDEDISVISDDLNKESNNVSELQENMEESVDKLRVLQNGLIENQDSIKDLETDVIQLEEDVAALYDIENLEDVEEFAEDLRSLERSFITVIEDVNSIRSNKQELANIVNNLEELTDMQQEDLDKLLDVAAMQECVDKLEGDVKDIYIQLTEIRDIIENEINSVETSINELSNKLNNKVADLNNSIQLVSDNLQTETKDIRDTIDSLSNELNNELERINSDIQNLEQIKVDKIEGKSLSEEDFTTELLRKLNGIEESATNYIFDEDYNSLKNTPEKLSEFENDPGYLNEISEERVTQHQKALEILEEQVSDLDKYTQTEVDTSIEEAKEEAIDHADGLTSSDIDLPEDIRNNIPFDVNNISDTLLSLGDNTIIDDNFDIEEPEYGYYKKWQSGMQLYITRSHQLYLGENLGFGGLWGRDLYSSYNPLEIQISENFTEVFVCLPFITYTGYSYENRVWITYGPDSYDVVEDNLIRDINAMSTEDEVEVEIAVLIIGTYK